MLRVLQPKKKNLQPYLLQRQVQMWVVIREHRYSNCFEAMLQNKLHVFCCLFYHSFMSVVHP